MIRLCEPETKGLGISEGIETALAVVQRVGWGPVWATGSAGGIRNFPTLIERTLHIFVDHDEAGIASDGSRRVPSGGARTVPSDRPCGTQGRSGCLCVYPIFQRAHRAGAEGRDAPNGDGVLGPSWVYASLHEVRKL